MIVSCVALPAESGASHSRRCGLSPERCRDTSHGRHSEAIRREPKILQRGTQRDAQRDPEVSKGDAKVSEADARVGEGDTEAGVGERADAQPGSRWQRCRQPFVPPDQEHGPPCEDEIWSQVCKGAENWGCPCDGEV